MPIPIPIPISDLRPPIPGRDMLRDFKAFLLKQNILALALAVVVGTATNDLVQAIVRDFIMPIVQAVTPTDAWREATLELGPVAFLIGDFAAVLLNFLIIGLVAWRITKMFIKPPPPEEKPAIKQCRFCKMEVDAEASRCAYCTSELAA
jgi:large conductance mechanosensitive channel